MKNTFFLCFQISLSELRNRLTAAFDANLSKPIPLGSLMDQLNSAGDGSPIKICPSSSSPNPNVSSQGVPVEQLINILDMTERVTDSKGFVSLKRLNRSAHGDLIDNYQAVAEVLSGTRFQRFLR